MKKIMNAPVDFVDESLFGIAKAHSDKLCLHPENPRGIYRTEKKDGKVAIVTGGGYGHLPLFLGYVGKGMCDGCAVGNVFTSPSSQAIVDVTTAVSAGKGVLYLIGNYMGDTMNFEMASEMVAMDDIETVLIRAGDDIASASREEADGRRGVAGILFAYKVAGALADRGYSLEEVAEKTRQACTQIATFGVGFSPCQLPEADAPIFTLDDDQMELGIGIHGEKGQKRCKMMTAKELAEFMLNPVLDDIPVAAGDRVAVLVNGLGATSREELYILYNEVDSILSGKKISVAKALVGEYVTSMEMSGASISVFKLDAETEELLNDPACTPIVSF